MKRKINLETTFSTIRQLPVEISFEQVEDWLNNSSNKKQATNRWLPYWLIQLARWRPFN